MGERGEFTKSQSTTPAGGIEPACGGLPKQQAVGRTIVPGERETASTHFAWKRKSFQALKEVRGSSHCGGASHGEFQTF